VVFSISPSGTGYTVLKSFSVGDGAPGSLIASNGVIFGATSGGLWGDGAIFSMATNGGAYSVLRSFSGNDGNQPNALILSGGTLYGAAGGGGVFNAGTIFKINTDGTGFNVLNNFAVTNGIFPEGLAISGNTLYGITASYGYGHYIYTNANDYDYTDVPPSQRTALGAFQESAFANAMKVADNYDHYWTITTLGANLTVPVLNQIPGSSGFFQLNVAADPLPPATKVGTFHMDAGGNLTFTAGPN
jgi:uncharacterized repeat protein (TIGR03803 family)